MQKFVQKACTWKMEKEIEKDKKSPSSSKKDNKLTKLASDGHANGGDDADHRIRHRSSGKIRILTTFFKGKHSYLTVNLN